MKQSYDVSTSLEAPSSNSIERMKSASEFWQREKGNDLRYEKSLSHHVGARNWEEDKFFAYGHNHVQLYKQLLRFLDIPMSEDKIRVVEWGPGGGANALAFGKMLNCEYFGADISQENLDETKRLITEYGLSHFNGVHIDIYNPESIFDQIKENSIDFYLCTAVFPHLPDKEYALRLARIAKRLLKPNGICMFHILLSDAVKSEYGDYAKHVHANTVFTYEEAVNNIANLGFDSLYAIRDTVAKYSYFFFKNKQV